MAATYFTCTLGQAQSLGLTNSTFKNINNFIDSQAEATPSQAAVGFAVPSKSESEWQGKTWSFLDLADGSKKVATLLQEINGELLNKSDTVALICPSTPEFLFTWLALMRLGHPVLLIAPQCQPAAIAHLCKACQTTVIFHDESYTAQSEEATQLSRDDGGELHAVELPFSKDHPLSDIMKREAVESANFPSVRETDVAYLHHTSGTSSGVPKPIPQTHRAGAGVLPSLPDGKHCATFTTTPLYHGGVADAFRAWTSGALIWLFPGKGVPITAANVIKCLDAASRSTGQGHPPIKYFASVPYVLQMMEADERGFKYLENMDIVGVGGAALPAEVGDRMVSKGINLISRFGSAECGFVMSSHRDYAKDKEWQYLRSNAGAEYLTFEKNEDGLAELVIKPGWPHMAKSNREDGSFATADLFALHDNVPDAWRYHSRADSQLTLVTGKKFDPAPLEGAIATADLLDDVLIFGNAQPFPGVLLFRSKTAQDVPDQELVQMIWPAIEKLNSGSQDHARIPKKMLVPMPVLDQPLEKSSKGTLQRSVVENRFAQDIDKAYTNMGSFNVGDVPDEKVSHVIIEMIESIVPKKAKLADDTDLFSYGVDSVAGMQIRYGLRQLLPQSTKQLPLNVVEDCGTVKRLAEYVVKQRHGQELSDDEDELKLMLRLVDQYSNFDNRSRLSSTNGQGRGENDKGDVVVLTGATGALGAHLLNLYRQLDSVKKVYCLVRGADVQASTERVHKALEQRNLGGLKNDDEKVEVLQTSLGDDHLGLSSGDYERIAQDVSIVMHVAWSVNFRMRLRSFAKDNIANHLLTVVSNAGVTNLINLALRSGRSQPARFAYCSSVASVMAYSNGASIPEQIIGDPKAASTLGYSRSKWVAEQICSRANERSQLKGRIAIFRVGQLSGDTQNGIWNTSEAWPMMLSSVKLSGALPNLDKETLDWLPVDIAAVALMQGIASVDGSGDGAHVLHVLNEHRRPTWPAMLQWLKRRRAFDIVDPSKWVARLEAMQEGDGADHPAYKLLDHWKRAYAPEHHESDDTDPAPTVLPFDMARTKHAVAVLRDVSPVDEEYFAKIWDWIDETM
ncbi:acetyl-CoA synthetase-like protein [Aureobasidium subglaciale]|nr:acetyl-CoA synthetase-like protein [Aureobasidium subglaciale]KAI5218532.1 acetyl-CoA synthetase-like protein [Aureobasidium subglaciale]KAI5222117.1 acetyl-CoA synthetase-like protein [Aureobasidium subglaciale]KAI5259671.1 acetyl-CoA synthetase-like protein [Aureobasidium subglaciale]